MQACTQARGASEFPQHGLAQELQCRADVRRGAAAPSPCRSFGKPETSAGSSCRLKFFVETPTSGPPPFAVSAALPASFAVTTSRRTTPNLSGSCLFS